MPKVILDRQSEAKDTFMNNIRKAIKHRLVDVNMTQKQLAKMIGMEQSMLSKRLKHPRCFRIDEIYNIARVLKVNVTELMD